MDAKKVGVHFTSGLILLLVIAGLVFCARTTRAQNGSCPDWTSVMLPVPHGYYPGAMALCTDGPTRVEHVQGSEYPCTGGIRVDGWDPDNQGQASIYIVSPGSMSFPSGRARIRFQVNIDRFAVSQYDIWFKVTSFNPDDQFIASNLLNIEAFPFVYSQDMGGSAKIFTVETELNYMQDGYAVIEVHEPSGPFYIFSYMLFGVKIQDSAAPPLSYCHVNGQLPPTLTPTPTNTPTGTPPPTNTPAPSNTPTGTPPDSPTPSHTPPASNTPTNTPTPQAFPTSSGGTPSPFPTRTPNSVPTVPPQNTPTRLSVVSFPTVNFPGVNVPTFSAPSIAEIGTSEPFNLELTPNATLQADQTRIASLNLESQAVISRWYTATNWASSMFSLTITNTTGLSNVVEIAGIMSESIVVPFTYARALREYVPNLWPLILFLLLGTGWVLFNLLLKWIIPILTFIFDLIKKLPFA